VKRTPLDGRRPPALSKARGRRRVYALAYVKSSRPSWPVNAALFSLAPIGVALALALGPDPVASAAHDGLVARGGDYEGSATCRTCHPDQFESWARTFHSTMTQRPSRETVAGQFDGKEVELFGKRATPFERDGEFWMRLPAEHGTRETKVALCVGSRRYQQYFELAGDSVGDTYKRLPLVWHIAEQRWIHINGAFLEPDDDNWNSHASTWNENCIFCHNTAPQPHMLEHGERGFDAKKFASRTAELGIACEACHGPGEQHALGHVSPFERYASHVASAGDPTIVDPRHLPQKEALAVCGQCHSQRLPAQLALLDQFLDTGPTFRPGDDLGAHVAPITRDTPSVQAELPRLFSDRFWNDGTARLTAYEYLGVTQSPCVKGGELTCNSCHTMHGGDIHGQVEPEMRGDRACAQCHADVASNIAAHTHHAPESSGSRCLDCHMPRMVYGVLEIHRSHRIESPDVRRDVEAGRPNACTLCHTSKSALWAADKVREWWGTRYERPTARPDGASLELPEAVASLHAGDAVQRAVYAANCGIAGGASNDQERVERVANLLIALGDGYPSIRYLARRSLIELDGALTLGMHAELTAFDHLAPVEKRTAALRDLLAHFAERARGHWKPPAEGLFFGPTFQIDMQRGIALLNRQSERVIAIGE
jgi:hypothetical protein